MGSGRFQRVDLDLTGVEFKLAEQDMVDVYASDVTTVLIALGHPGALVTDLSDVGDFIMDENIPRDLQRQLYRLSGIECTLCTPIWRIAQAINKKGY